LRVRSIFLLAFLAYPLAGFSQSTLNFPRAFTPADLASTGFAVVNPGITSAPVTFTLFNANGVAVRTSSQTIPAGSQAARLGSELFPNVSEPGWVQLTSAAGGLQGFWVGGNFDTFTDGADAALSGSDLLFPLVTTNTEINVANTAATTNNVALQLFGADGTELAAAVARSIAPNAVLQSAASALFPTANLDAARYIRVTGTAALTGTAVISGFLVDEWGVANAVSVAAAANEANFPHVVSGAGGGGNYTTVLGVTNLSASGQSVSVTFTPEDGSSPVTVTRAIPANGSLRDTAQNLFNLPAGFHNGWLRVAGSGALTAFVAYADSVAGGLAIVPVQTTPRISLLFAHIADLNPWMTGLALLNTTAASATVSVYAMTPGGALIGGADNVSTARFTIPAGAKAAKLLSELIPQTQQRTSDSGFILVTSTQPLYGLELFFKRNLRILANVAAGPGAGFTAPAAPVPLTLSSVSPSRAAVGSTLTLTGSGFSPNGGNTVVFASASGTVTAAAGNATATSLTVVVPGGAITGPVAVQTGGQTSSSQIVEIISTSTSLPPTGAFTVDPASTTEGVDIYVPAAVAALNVDIIGLGDPGSAVSLGSTGAVISRGQTKFLVLGGTGLSAGSGLSVSVTGDGVTTGQVQLQSGFALVLITVSSTAPQGPRNVIVTNSSLDMSVLSGGLFIQ